MKKYFYLLVFYNFISLSMQKEIVVNKLKKKRNKFSFCKNQFLTKKRIDSKKKYAKYYIKQEEKVQRLKKEYFLLKKQYDLFVKSKFSEIPQDIKNNIHSSLCYAGKDCGAINKKNDFLREHYGYQCKLYLSLEKFIKKKDYISASRSRESKINISPKVKIFILKDMVTFLKNSFQKIDHEFKKISSYCRYHPDFKEFRYSSLDRMNCLRPQITNYYNFTYLFDNFCKNYEPQISSYMLNSIKYDYKKIKNTLKLEKNKK